MHSCCSTDLSAVVNGRTNNDFCGTYKQLGCILDEINASAQPFKSVTIIL